MSLFSFHVLNEDGKYKTVKIADAFDALLFEISKYTKDNREFSITKTKLEEACFFAKKSVAVQIENQA